MTDDREFGLAEDLAEDWHPQSSTCYATASRPRPPTAEQVIAEVSAALRKDQQADGHWCYPLEADTTIPAEYVLLQHFLDEIDQPLSEKIAVYLRNMQADHGGWPLFEGGDLNISA